MIICKHCQLKEICSQGIIKSCDKYQPYSIDALEKEKRAATPERLKEIINELDFYYYGRVLLNSK